MCVVCNTTTGWCRLTLLLDHHLSQKPRALKLCREARRVVPALNPPLSEAAALEIEHRLRKLWKVSTNITHYMCVCVCLCQSIYVVCVYV